MVPKTDLSVDKEAPTVTVPAEEGKRSVVGFEDIRVLFPKDCFAMTVLEAIDCIDEPIYRIYQKYLTHLKQFPKKNEM